MSATDYPIAPTYPGAHEGSRGRIVTVMRWAALLLASLLILVLTYAMVTRVFFPPTPRTLQESTIARARAMVEKDPSSGRAWAALAGAEYEAGDKALAWKTIHRARDNVADRSILFVNGRELDFLILEHRNDEVIERADEFIATEANYQLKEKAEDAAKNISVPDQVTDNTEAVRLFVLKGTAQGNLGRWKSAVKTFDAALLLTDTAADVVALRGWARLRSGDAAGAKSDFERALRYLPNDPSAKQGLAEAERALSSVGD